MPFTDSPVRRSLRRYLPPSHRATKRIRGHGRVIAGRFNGRSVQPPRTMRPAGEPSGATVICGLPIVKISYER